MTPAHIVLPSCSSSLVNRHGVPSKDSECKKKKKSHVISDAGAECYNNSDYNDNASVY